MSPDWARGRMAVAGTFWLWGAFLFSGFVARDRRTRGTVVAAIAIWLLAGPMILGFAPTPSYQVAGAILGALTGSALAGTFVRTRKRADGDLDEARRAVADAAT